MIRNLTLPTRLTEIEKRHILEAVESTTKFFGLDWLIISLFGSRTDMHALGGDIDLFIKVVKNKEIDIFLFKQKLRMALKELLGEQKIDLVIDDGITDLGVFGQLVMKQKVDLWIKSS